LAGLLLLGLMLYMAPVILAVLVPFALISAVGALFQGK
jgi:predicted Co/Zn/Cd cation transporter (cation efflux family)